ncbi:MAG: UDP-N-acetylmuramate--L-alanine ligase [Campylobacterales bacterium]
MNIHFVGIGGIGLSGIARFLQNEGHRVSRSDISDNHYTKKLKKEGFEVTIPHSATAVKDRDLIIYSAAIKPTNIELVEAKKLGIKTLSRKEALPMVLRDKRVFAVAGAHGKSTTTAILSSIMNECSALIGAESKEFGSNARIKESECVVFEADESDASFLNCNPSTAIVTNAEPEHMEYYKNNLSNFYQAYEDFLRLAKKRVINAEDSFLSTLDIDAIKLYPSRDISEIEFVLVDDEPHTRFRLKDVDVFDVWGFGEHIAIDAALAVLAAIEEGYSVDTIKRNIKNYRGIKKRFDILQNNTMVLIDDYAHHPTEIEATLESIRLYAKLKGLKDVVSIWQPHKYSRTITNLDRFKECFKGSDRLIILPVWGAGEDSVEIDFEGNFSAYNLLIADRIKRSDKSIEILKDDSVIERLSSAIVVGFGAGDITYQLRGA